MTEYSPNLRFYVISNPHRIYKISELVGRSEAEIKDNFEEGLWIAIPYSCAFLIKGICIGGLQFEGGPVLEDWFKEIMYLVPEKTEVEYRGTSPYSVRTTTRSLAALKNLFSPTV